MAKIHPFRGFRYDPARVGSVADVVTQPYDKISEPLRQTYLARHPHNIVRVIKNPDYQQAGNTLREWIESGILRQDETPAFYPYQQVFRFEREEWSRLGFIGLISLEDPHLKIKGHERILDKPLEDRLKLIRETEANEGLVFTLYSEPERRSEEILRRATEALPVLELEDDYGVIHRLWLSTSPELNRALQEVLQPLPLYIADGHHRFQTSLLFHRECLQQGWRPAARESFDKRLVALFNMESPALKILPTHRALRNLQSWDVQDFVARLGSFFTLQETESAEELAASMKEGKHRLGLVLRQPPRHLLLTLKGGVLDDPAFLPGIRGAARELDVNLLHEGILRPLLGIGPAELAAETHVDYYRDRGQMLERLREGHYDAAFLLNPTTLEQVRQVSEAGEKMPQKSTDFYPKLLTGLVIMKMAVERQASPEAPAPETAGRRRE